MNEVVIRLRPLPDSAWIKQDPLFYRSDVSFAKEAAEILNEAESGASLALVSVRLNGRELPFIELSPTAFRVTPMMPLQGDYLVIYCDLKESHGSPAKPSEWPPATNPAPDLGYGLQRAVNAPMRHPQ